MLRLASEQAILHVSSTLLHFVVLNAIELRAWRERSVLAIGVHIVERAVARAAIAEEVFQEEAVASGEAGADAED
jgi:hypothetical protein